MTSVVIFHRLANSREKIYYRKSFSAAKIAIELSEKLLKRHLCGIICVKFKRRCTGSYFSQVCVVEQKRHLFFRVDMSQLFQRTLEAGGVQPRWARWLIHPAAQPAGHRDISGLFQTKDPGRRRLSRPGTGSHPRRHPGRKVSQSEGKRGTRSERWKHDEARLEKETRRLEKETPTVTVFLDSWLV